MERNTEGDGKRDGQADTENSQGGERERKQEAASLFSRNLFRICVEQALGELQNVLDTFYKLFQNKV